MSRPEEQNSCDEYNYKAFTRSESAGRSGEFKISIRAGEEAPDFELATIEGERIRLSEFCGKRTCCPNSAASRDRPSSARSRR